MTSTGDVPTVLRSFLEQWDLRPDGAATQGEHAFVLPVRTSDGADAVLKVGGPGADSEHEHLVLRRWGGTGAVRLLRADPPHRVVLLERLHATDLHTLSDLDACEVVAGLYAHIQFPLCPNCVRSLRFSSIGYSTSRPCREAHRSPVGSSSRRSPSALP